jgi:predicted DNA binding CopG/RHH family protein
VTFWKAITDREQEEWEKKAQEYLASDAAVLLRQSSSIAEVD